MTSKRTPKIQNHILIALTLFIAVLTVLIAFAAPARQTGTRQPSAKPSAALVPSEARLPAPALPDLRPPGTNSAQRASARQRKKATSATPDGANTLFLPAVTYSTGGLDSITYDNSTWVSVDDVNRDGKPDVLVANICASYRLDGCSSGANVGVLLGNGDGTFQPVVTYASGGYYAFTVIVADVNGDGKPDLLVANGCYITSPDQPCPSSGSVGVLLGNGDGTFQPVRNYASGGLLSWIAVADVNGDGKPDLLVSNQDGGTNGQGSVGVLLGNGDGTFQPVQTYSSGGLQTGFIVVADVNADGKPDLLVSNISACNNCEGSVGVLLGNGDGTFQPVVTYGPVPAANVLQVADLRNDGELDLVVNGGGSFDGGVLSVLLGNGNGTFQPAVVYAAGGGYNGPPLVIDLNGDHILDLAVPNGENCSNTDSSACVGVLLGNGDGTFQPAVQYAVGGAALLAAGDVNGDGIIDLVTADEYCPKSVCGNDHGSANVLLGNGDGTFQAVVSYDSGGYSTTWVGTADVNGDGRLDVVAVSPNAGPVEGLVGVLINDTVDLTTTTTLASSLNPSIFGEGVTLTAAVTSSSGAPIGTVVFTDVSTATTLGSATLVNGKASIAVSSLAAGSHSITAAYQGSATFRGSTSSPVIQAVNTASTTTSLTSSENPAGTGQSVSFTATVTSQFGGAATGSVAFSSGSQTLGTATLSGNRATLTTSFSTPGTYSISAKYSGDANNTGSTSSALSQVINAAITTTTTALTSSLNPSLVGEAVTFTATVTSTAGSPPNGETITFNNGSAVLGTAPLSAGSASLTTSSLAAGIYTITASYGGDANFSASTSPGLRQVVNSTAKSATATTVASSLNPSIYGQNVTWTAAVTTSGSIPPTGKVNFVWGDGNSLGAGTLNSSGVATLTRFNLNADHYPLIAKYVGDANNDPSASPILNQVVTQTTSAATITSSPNPSTQGQAVTFTAEITSPTATPTGPVTFTAGKTVLGTVELSKGKATLTISTLPVGSTTVTVTYPWNSDIAESSASGTQVVQ